MYQILKHTHSGMSTEIDMASLTKNLKCSSFYFGKGLMAYETAYKPEKKKTLGGWQTRQRDDVNFLDPSGLLCPAFVDFPLY